MVALPKDLEKQMREMAEKCWSKVGERGFTAGFRACYELLSTMGPEFDEDEAQAKGADKYVLCVKTFSTMPDPIAMFREGARYQHSLMSAQLAARDTRIKELEEVGRKDYEDMRKFQAKFIEADHHIIELKSRIQELQK